MGSAGEEGKGAGSDARLRARWEQRGNPGPRSVPPRCLGVARSGVASSSAQRRRGGVCAMQDPRGHGGSRGAAGPVSLCLRSLGSVKRAPRAPGEDNRCLLRHPGPTGGSPHARWRLCLQATLEHRRGGRWGSRTSPHGRAQSPVQAVGTRLGPSTWCGRGRKGLRQSASIVGRRHLAPLSLCPVGGMGTHEAI